MILEKSNTKYYQMRYSEIVNHVHSRRAPGGWCPGGLPGGAAFNAGLTSAARREEALEQHSLCFPTWLTISKYYIQNFNLVEFKIISKMQPTWRILHLMMRYCSKEGTKWVPMKITKKRKVAKYIIKTVLKYRFR